MLESIYSTAATVAVTAMPFPVDVKEPYEPQDELFKQVTLPGSAGDYRVRVVNIGYGTVSTIQIKNVDTQIPATDLEGQLYRVKAVLSEPELGINESYWLTLKQQDIGGVQNHNQYRVRGVSTSLKKSEWVYSEAREADNRLKIFELIHDILDMVTMLHDDDLQLFVETVVQDAFQALALKEDMPIPAFFLDPNDQLEHHLSEQMTVDTGHLSTINETQMAKIQDSISILTDALIQGFQEDFSSFSLEDWELSKVYNLFDLYEHEKDDWVDILLIKFLEDQLDHIVQSSEVEVLLDNGENKAIYLEGTYNLDIKGEILHAAMSLLPTDNFVLNAKSTVKLLTDKVIEENMEHSILEQTRETLHALKQGFKELLQVYPSEEIVKYLRMMNQDVFMPYLVIDQRLAEISTDLFDQIDRIEADDMIMEYQLANNTGVTRYMLVKDLADELIWGDNPANLLYQQEIKDLFLGLLTDKRWIYLDQALYEVIEVFAEMGERVSSDYKKLPVNQQEFILTSTADTMEQQVRHSVFEQEDSQVSFGDQSQYSTTTILSRKEEFLTQLIDTAYAANRDIPIDSQEPLLLNQLESSYMQLGLRDFLKDYYAFIALDSHEINQAFNWTWSEKKSINVQSDIYNVYKFPLKDQYARSLKEQQDIDLQTELQDHFELNGTETVLYALGDIEYSGWPLGVFRLGVNTLKGVT